MLASKKEEQEQGTKKQDTTSYTKNPPTPQEKTMSLLIQGIFISNKNPKKNPQQNANFHSLPPTKQSVLVCALKPLPSFSPQNRRGPKRKEIEIERRDGDRQS
jgi:hypothetical protein